MTTDIRCRGIRGATTVTENSREALIEATRELLDAIIQDNSLEMDDIASAFFTTTPELNAEFPAVAARQIGWTQVPMLCGHEMSVPGSMPRCLRVLIHVNTAKQANEITHVYLRDAAVLRPDLVQEREKKLTAS